MELPKSQASEVSRRGWKEHVRTEGARRSGAWEPGLGPQRAHLPTATPPPGNPRIEDRAGVGPADKVWWIPSLKALG